MGWRRRVGRLLTRIVSRVTYFDRGAEVKLNAAPDAARQAARVGAAGPQVCSARTITQGCDLAFKSLQILRAWLSLAPTPCRRYSMPPAVFFGTTFGVR